MCDGSGKDCTCGNLSQDRHHHSHEGGHAPFHRLFGALHAEYDTQFGDAVCCVPDDDATAAARSDAAADPSVCNLHSLAAALCFQLRYKEAAEVLSRILAVSPLDYTANRKLALCMLKTRDFKRARELFALCDKLNPDDLDVVYRQGLCEFYDGDFGRAEEYFLRCYPLCRDDGDMYIAVVYWHLLTLIRLGKDTGDALGHYSPDIKIGHHVGYLLTCRLFSGEDTLEHLLSSTADADEMTRTLLLYGIYHYFLMQGKKSAARAALRDMLSYTTYWGSFAWIAAYGDGKREGMVL